MDVLCFCSSKSHIVYQYVFLWKCHFCRFMVSLPPKPAMKEWMCGLDVSVSRKTSRVRADGVCFSKIFAVAAAQCALLLKMHKLVRNLLDVLIPKDCYYRHMLRLLDPKTITKDFDVCCVSVLPNRSNGQECAWYRVSNTYCCCAMESFSSS
jgi:hypothetical protein